MLRRRLLVVVSIPCIWSLLAYAQQPPKGGAANPGSSKKSQAKSVSGNTSPSHFNVDQDYCDSYNSPSPGYHYNSGGVTSPAAGDEKKPTDPINNLSEFDDDGSTILTTSSSKSFPLDDGSDSSRLLVRAFSAGTCDVTLTVKPTSLTIGAGQQIKFAATYRGAAPADPSLYDPSVTWSLTPAGDKSGTVSSDGIYNAPASVPDTNPIIVTATSVSNSAVTASAQVMIDPAGAPEISSIPSKAPAAPYKLLDAEYYVINVVRWKRQSAAYQANSNEWYIFNTSDKSIVRQSPFSYGSFKPTVNKASDTRIYGSKKVGFLAIHLRGDDISQQDFKSLRISYNVSTKTTEPLNVQDVEALLSLIGFGAAATTPIKQAEKVLPSKPPKKPLAPPTPVGLYGGGMLTQGLDSLPAAITFEADVSFPSSSSGTSAKKSAAKAGAPPATPRSAGNNSPASKGTSPPACDSSVTLSSGTQPPCTLTQSVSDEGLEYWDVSAGVPFNAINQYTFSSTDGTVTEKSSAKLNAYGFFDLYLHGVDLANPAWNAWPHLMLGLPFSGKVFNKPFVGVGFLYLKGFNRSRSSALKWFGNLVPVQANLYAGWVIQKEFAPSKSSGLTVGSTASTGVLSNSLLGNRDWMPQFGIEFSIKSLKKAASGGNSAQSGNTTAKKSGNGTS